MSEEDSRFYRSPFVTRWASEEMQRTWGDMHKFRLWRSL